MKELTEFDIWWNEHGRALFDQTGALGRSAEIASKQVARAAWSYAQSIKHESAA